MPQQSFDEFRELLQQTKPKLFTKINKLFLKTALRMERDGKLNATRGSTSFVQRTGRLRSSISGLVTNENGQSRLVLRAGGASNGSEVDYAGYIEFGTRLIRRRLFLGKSYEKNRQKFTIELRKIIGQVFNE